MKRLFQHYEGKIKSLEGLNLKNLICLQDSDDIILIWIKTELKYLRVFIDGCYCGIDEYEEDNSHVDVDEDITLIDKTDWIYNLKIKSAFVETDELPLICLNILFTNGSRLVFNCDEEEKCTLLKTSQ